ncbi:hypothetical protein LSH36_32g23014 [Paralvinella palmiformis]|uniref:F-BAR domain-containing protein n=1 Tax=Paralvinella palmiformis TaxID=53620 RepID=A0AAD9K9T7_9ANNE|nr:hypothetical protein LSH36_32g23014 [Paralvinella palmiformis]
MVKEEKLKQETAKADETYQNMIKTLDEVKKTWEKDITKFFKLAQRLEMERLQYLHNEIWITTNFISQTCVDDDNHCENIRKSLEQCDFDADINLFIKSMSTGTEKPAPLRYVPDHYKLMDKDRFT